MPISVLIADDRAIIRDSLKAALDAAGFLVLGAVSGQREALALACETAPDVLVIDSESESLDPFELAAAIRGFAPGCRPVILADRARRVAELLVAGVRGYLLWSQDKASIVSALGEVAAGKLHLCREARSALPPRSAIA